MFVVDKGLNERFHQESKWKWPGTKNVDVYLLTKRIRHERYNAMLLFVDELVDPEMDEEGNDYNNLINHITITKQLTLENIDNIRMAITEEYGEGQTSDVPTTENLVLTQDVQSYIR